MIAPNLHGPGGGRSLLQAMAMVAVAMIHLSIGTGCGGTDWIIVLNSLKRDFAFYLYRPKVSTQIRTKK